jgi:hypothetical protein
MTDDFEDHFWMDIVPPDVLELYSMYRRKTFVGPAPALLAIDLYEVVYAGGAQPPAKLAKSHPNSCGEYAPCGHRTDEAAVRRRTRGRPSGLLFHGRHPCGEPAGLHHRDQAQSTPNKSVRLRHSAGIQARAG